MKVFVQDYREYKSKPHFHGVYECMLERGHEVIRFVSGDELELCEDSIVYGGVKSVTESLIQLGLEIPDVPTIPNQWKSFAKRKYSVMPFSEISQKIGNNEFGFFIKPVEHKLFNGCPITCFSDFLKVPHLPPETPIFYSELKNIISEYRCIFQFGELKYGAHYTGDFRAAPDWEQIEYFAKNNDSYIQNAIILDFGVTAEGETILIEANDVISAGYYGTPRHLFCESLEIRWDELKRK